jgi:hypothetical protein
VFTGSKHFWVVVLYALIQGCVTVKVWTSYSSCVAHQPACLPCLPRLALPTLSLLACLAALPALLALPASRPARLSARPPVYSPTLPLPA